MGIDRSFFFRIFCPGIRKKKCEAYKILQEIKAMVIVKSKPDGYFAWIQHKRVSVTLPLGFAQIWK